MVVILKPVQRLLLFHCSFTCIYLPGILILLKYNGNLYNIGSYKFMTILLILMFAELVKLLFSILHTDSLIINNLDSYVSYKTKKTWTKYIKDICKFCLVTMMLFTVYYVIIILYGAPIVYNREETVVLTITLTTLTFIPASLHLGIELAINIITGAPLPKNNILVDAVKTNIKGTLLGAWLGAIVIPLDWDRPWQAWPIPCIVGALAGYVSSHFITLLNTFSIFKTHKKLH